MTFHTHIRGYMGTAAALALLAGCAVGPDFHRPALSPTAGYDDIAMPTQTVATAAASGQSQSIAPGADLPAQWWTQFHSKPLDDLIATALKSNPSVTAAQAALREAREIADAQRGAFFPTIDGGFTSSRQKDATGSVAPTSASGNPILNLHTAQVNVSYVPDLFGGTRRTVEAAAARADAQRFALEATYLTLTSNLVAAAVQEAALRDQIAATEEIIKAETDLLKLLRRQNALGQIAMADVVAQETALAQSQEALIPLQKQLVQQRHMIAFLAGRFPNDKPEQFDLSSLTLPADLPLTLPAALVEQRPDVKVAEANLHTASAQIGVAVADMLPSLTLTGGAGSSATEIDHLFTAGTGFWSVAAGLTQPIFAGGALRHKARAARAAYDQAAAQYRLAVLAAFQNVADSLYALDSDAHALQAAVAAEHAAAESLRITRRQVELGQVSFPTLLNAQQAYQQTRIATIQAQAARYTDTAALFQALGGGWWNRSRTETEASAG